MSIERIETGTRMSRIVKHRGTVYLCGQTAGEGEWDITRQTKECLVKIENLLEKAGSSIEQLLSVTIYVSDMKNFTAMNAVWDAWVPEGYAPARACVEAKMARPEILVEFSVTAACDDTAE